MTIDVAADDDALNIDLDDLIAAAKAVLQDCRGLQSDFKDGKSCQARMDDANKLEEVTNAAADPETGAEQTPSSSVEKIVEAFHDAMTLRLGHVQGLLSKNYEAELAKMTASVLERIQAGVVVVSDEDIVSELRASGSASKAQSLLGDCFETTKESVASVLAS